MVWTPTSEGNRLVGSELLCLNGLSVGGLVFWLWEEGPWSQGRPRKDALAVWYASRQLGK